MDTICIRGALTHNLQNLDLDIPRDQLIAVTRLSGASKSSLAFDTLYAEAYWKSYQETESHSVREDLARYLASKPCTACHGARLNVTVRHVFIADWAALPLQKLKKLFEKLNLFGQRAQIALRLQNQIVDRLKFLINVGLNYLSLDRIAETLSGGESQHIHLARQIGSGLVCVMYILDEPSIDLHQRGNSRLLSTLLRLGDLCNTVIVVEHDEEAIHHAAYVVSMEPGAGMHGGRVIEQDSPAAIMRNSNSLTDQYLSNERRIYPV
ncbi:UNVERIFIED_CONTAM: uvrA [Trichonephila clavipes]